MDKIPTPENTSGSASSDWVKVPVSSLRPGWVADRDIRLGADLLIAAGVAVTPGMLIQLKQRQIEHVQVHPQSELAYQSSESGTDDLTSLLASAHHLLEVHGVREAISRDKLDKAVNQIQSFFKVIELGQPVDFEEMRETVASLVDQFLANAHLAVKLLDLDSHDRYTYRHSINTGLLYLLVAKDWLNYDELCDVVFGAILHDLGKARIDVNIINKAGPLDDAEWALMRMHPLWSYEQLRDSGASTAAMSVARSHHERLDGKGYPDQLAGDQIDRYARLAAICDVYDALTTKRSYKRKLDFAFAIDVIIQGCGIHFDHGIVNSFIRRIGRYPVGSFVRLSTGEIAIVVRTNEHAVNRPVVSRVLEKDGTIRSAGEALDLSSRTEFHIAGVVGSRESSA
jgi:HD-GYP domain-containing protein (c-di-GMP phosphodiesterase class II)